MTRVGIGFDAHGFGGTPPLLLGGVAVDERRGLSATSDGDVLIHAVIDAMFGAVNLGDIGSHFPSTDPQWHGVASTDLLARAAATLQEAGYRVVQVDSSVIAETVRVAPHREQMVATIAGLLALDVAAVSVKATTTDGLGFLGRDEGVACLATVTVAPSPYE